ncbi:MAG TPA: UvrD-helicase domain-containing protein [Acidimicrobiales bacterium]|nr:UvrD-helicase domain-containing protein [Acidimicrobiales bacterium]
MSAFGGLSDDHLFSLDDDPPAPPPGTPHAPPPAYPADDPPPSPPHLTDDYFLSDDAPQDDGPPSWPPAGGDGDGGEHFEGDDYVQGDRAAARSNAAARLLEGLNDAQRAAVEHRGGPLLVVAGAGSGKTRVLTRRIAHLLATDAAAPWQILAITFTNKAADEMRRRVVDLVGKRAERMWVSTFHSACLRILRTHAPRLGYQGAFTVYDDSDSRRLIEIITAELGLDTKRFPSRSIAAVIGQAKSELVGPEAFEEDASFGADPFRRRIAQVYLEYQRRLLAANAMDFDDLLMQAARVLQTCDDVRRSYQDRFTHVLVDEYQDTNRAQNEIVLLLGRDHGNVTVVGDSDQSVYRWRGADIRNILEFEDAFPNATTVLLEQNYRSTQTILDAANAVIANNTSRRPKRLFTDDAVGDPICRYRAEDEHDEATWVASEVVRLRTAHDLSYGDVAVFYRTNAQSRVVEEALVRAGVPYKVIGGTRFYDRREVKDLLAYLRVLANPDDEVSARRILNVPKRGIGNTSVLRLTAWATSQPVRRSVADALAHAEEAGLTGKARAGADQLDQLLADLRGLVGTVPPGELVQAVAERSGYLAELVAERTHEADGRIENIAELVGVAEEYDDLTELLETVALVSDADELDAQGARVNLMTLHTAKGLEFPAVFLVGLEDGIFPHFRTLGEPDELEEERRLCYVGITRARRWLYLSHAWVRTLWGNTSHNIPSRFLAEIPAELVKDVGVVGGRSGSDWGGSRRRGGDRYGGDRYGGDDRADRGSYRPRSDDWDTGGGPAGAGGSWRTDEDGPVFGAGRGPASAGAGAYGDRPGPRRRREKTTTGAEDLGLAAGDRVVHDHWGEGVVIATVGKGERAQAKVMFASVGEKRLLLSATPLKRA